jgi:hypothetical protein
MAVNTGQHTKPYSIPHIENLGFDPEFQVPVVQPLGYDGVNVQRSIADSTALKVTTVGTITYVAVAAPGTAQATAKWQAYKIDSSGGVVLTWADGDSSFDNVATDLTALTYS